MRCEMERKENKRDYTNEFSFDFHSYIRMYVSLDLLGDREVKGERKKW